MSDEDSLIKTIDASRITDSRGDLFVLEEGEHLSFPIRRAYYIANTPQGVSRGFHAHKNLSQLAVCVSGSCRIVLDNGRKREDVLLDDPGRALLIGKYIWREMHDFSPDCVLLVLADAPYDEADYIRDYEIFLKETAHG
ncbi:MAG: WxcM-like domain-containing protein [Micavibrio sp.]|nr:MAG: WxcM-like domain-containing protein [Micavibrio sp.]